MPKREIFVTELFTLCDPICVGDLRTAPKIYLCKVTGWYWPFKFFAADWVCGKNYPPPDEYAVKIILCILSMRYSYMYWACGKKSPTCTKYAVKNLLRVLSMGQKLFQVYWVDRVKQDGIFSKLFHTYWVCGKKLFHTYWVCGKKYSTSTEYGV